MATQTFEVPTENLPLVLDKIERLRKRANRTGAHLSEPIVSDATFCLIGIPHGPRNVWTTIEVEIDTAPVRFEGWHLTGVIEPMQGGNAVIVREVPGEAVPMQYRDNPTNCDHCSTQQARRETFAIEHEDGRTMQVGRQCLADFLGGQTAEEIVRMQSYLRMLEEAAEETEWPESGRIEHTAQTLEILAVACRVIEQDGTYRTATGNDRPTRASVTTIFFPQKFPEQARRADEAIIAHYGTPSPANYAKAQQVRDWAVQQGGDNYLMNIATLAQMGWVPVSKWGLLVSAPAAFDRAHKRAEETAKIEAERAAAGPVPTGKVTIEGEVVSIKEHETAFGVTEKMTVKGPEGWRVWTTIPRAIAEVKVGDRVSFSATVEPAGGDRTFGFAKRPSKAQIL